MISALVWSHTRLPSDSRMAAKRDTLCGGLRCNTRREDSMAENNDKTAGPDLTKGVDASMLSDGGMLSGKVGEEDVLLVRRGADIFALAAHCTHYHGPLADGLVVGETIRCPWHHACFDLATGEPVRAPALSPLDCWTVEQRQGKIFV